MSEMVFWGFNLALFPWSAYSHQFHITHAHNIGVLQTVASDEDSCDQNENHPIHPLAYSQLEIITSIPY